MTSESRNQFLRKNQILFADDQIENELENDFFIILHNEICYSDEKKSNFVKLK